MGSSSLVKLMVALDKLSDEELLGLSVNIPGNYSGPSATSHHWSTSGQSPGGSRHPWTPGKLAQGEDPALISSGSGFSTIGLVSSGHDGASLPGA